MTGWITKLFGQDICYPRVLWGWEALIPCISPQSSSQTCPCTMPSNHSGLVLSADNMVGSCFIFLVSMGDWWQPNGAVVNGFWSFMLVLSFERSGLIYFSDTGGSGRIAYPQMLVQTQTCVGRGGLLSRRCLLSELCGKGPGNGGLLASALDAWGCASACSWLRDLGPIL